MIDVGVDWCTLLIWASMDAHRLKKELLGASFVCRLCLATHINIYLFKHQVLISEFKEIQEMVTKCKQLPKLYGALHNKLNNKSYKAYFPHSELSLLVSCANGSLSQGKKRLCGDSDKGGSASWVDDSSSAEGDV